MKLKILVDADGCPVVKQVLNIAKKYQIPVWLLSDTAHLQPFQEDTIVAGSYYLRTITVEKGADSVDFALLGNMDKGDIVVTQDYGLAALALTKGGRCINQNGMRYHEGNIDQLLLQRYVAREIRNAGGRTKGPAKRKPSDTQAFVTAFQQLCQEVLHSGV